MGGWVFGPKAGFITGSLAALISNFFLGQGPWTPWQMLAWGLTGATSGLMGKIFASPDRYLLALFGALWGYLFGLIMNTWHWLTFIYPLTWKTFLATWAASFWFDTAHAAANVFLGLAFGPGILAILRRYREKMEATTIPPGG
jgi:energy-coupling factor transport system substrate-specific component